MKHVLLSLIFTCAIAVPVSAQTVTPEIESLFVQLGQDQIIDVMREESFDYGDQIADMFFGSADAGWQSQLEGIYDRDWMRQIVLSSFAEALSDADIGAIEAFFGDELGSRIIALEVAAREAMLDESVLEAAKASAAEAVDLQDAKMTLIQTFIDSNDLIEMNVVGGMNGNYAFFMGLLDGGGLEGKTSPDMILSDVSAQEDEIRLSTTEWINGFLYLAYGPLSKADLESYISFSETEAGRAINRAIFVAYDDLFTELNYAVGKAAGLRMGQSDL